MKHTYQHALPSCNLFLMPQKNIACFLVLDVSHDNTSSCSICQEKDLLKGMWSFLFFSYPFLWSKLWILEPFVKMSVFFQHSEQEWRDVSKYSYTLDECKWAIIDYRAFFLNSASHCASLPTRPCRHMTCAIDWVWDTSYPFAQTKPVQMHQPWMLATLRTTVSHV